MRKSSINEYFNGYILVRLESLHPEELINLCFSNNIILREIERKNYTTIIFKMKQDQFLLFKHIIRNTNSNARIIKKYGVNFTYNRISRRKFFLIGSIIFFALLFFFSSIIWSVNIQGNKTISASLINDTLRKSGLKKGIFKYNIDFRKVEENVIRNIKEVSIVKITIIGTKVNVEIVERTLPTKIFDKYSPTNIVATKEGIITKIVSLNGVPIVKCGDLVKVNQILISGMLSDSDSDINKPAHAMGIINAKTWYEASEETKYNYKFEVLSGKYKSKIYYIIGKERLYTKNTNITFKKYDKIVNTTKIRILGFKTPVDKVTENYYEIVDAYRTLSKAEAEKISLNAATEKIKKLLPKNCKILTIKKFKTLYREKVKIRILYILEEAIGIEKVIN